MQSIDFFPDVLTVHLCSVFMFFFVSEREPEVEANADFASVESNDNSSIYDGSDASDGGRLGWVV